MSLYSSSFAASSAAATASSPIDWLSPSPDTAEALRDLVFFRCCSPCMRIAAMTTRESASLFLDSVVGSSGCSDIVATRDRFERLFCPSSVSLRLSGLISDDTLGDRESWRDEGRDNPCADDGRLSENGAPLASIEDLRRLYPCCDSLPRAAAAATPSPPLLRAFFLAAAASSNKSRLRTGDLGAASVWCSGARNWANGASGGGGESDRGRGTCELKSCDERGRACTWSSASWSDSSLAKGWRKGRHFLF
jgi:hypothetical protein